MKNLATAGGHGAAAMTDNLIMTGPAASALMRLLKAPFARRAWTELGYTLATLPLALAAFVFTVILIWPGPPWAISAPGVRKFAAGSRFFARELLGEDVPAPSGLRPVSITKAGVTTEEMRPGTELLGGRIFDPIAWRARGYFALKLPLAVAGVVVAAAGWLGGLFCLTFPAWWSLASSNLLAAFGIVNLAASFTLLPLGAALLLAGPWMLHGVTEADLRLVRGLLGPNSPAERIRALEETRARAVDDSAATLRSIERDLHDGTQAQLVALAMKLGLAKDKLTDTAPVDLARVTQLVDDAHRSALEAIADLRTLARGIHPAVLDSGLADALATLAARSAVPVEVITDIPERPSAAIETIAYFSAAELLTNVAKHSGARHATLEAVHVPGLLRVRVSDDGHGGANPAPDGGLRGLAERIRTVDGRLEISSPRGGPTVVTVELPSRA
jgi:signal transduction histidine kinase